MIENSINYDQYPPSHAAVKVTPLVLGIFSIFLFNIKVTNSPIIFGSHIVIVLTLIWIIMNKELRLNVTVGALLAAIGLHSMIGALAGQNSIFLVMENYLRMAIYLIVFSSIIPKTQEGFRHALSIYLKFSTYCAYIGLFALVAFLVGFKPGYDFSWILNSFHHTSYGGHFGLPRAQSVFGEPSHAVYTLTPACYVAVARIFGKHKDLLSLRAGLSIFLFIFMTNSTTAYATLPFLILLNIQISIKQVFSILILSLILGIGIAMGFSLDFENVIFKIDQLYTIYTENGASIGISGSSYTAYVGNSVAFEMLKSSFGIGWGLGSFEYNLAYNLGNLNVASGNMANGQTGGSLMARTIGELGIFGILIWVTLLLHTIKGALTMRGLQRTIHLAMLIGFLPFFYRMGTYEGFGLAFFAIMYIINYQYGLNIHKHELNTQYSSLKNPPR